MSGWPCCECCEESVCEIAPHTSPCDKCQQDAETSWRARAEAAEAQRDALAEQVDRVRKYAEGFSLSAGGAGWVAQGVLMELCGGPWTGADE